MRTALPVCFVLLLFTETVIACVDVLFVLDPSSEYSRSRSTKVALELAKRDGLRYSVAIRRHKSRYVFMMAKTTADLITALDTVDGDYERYLGMVTSEILRRRNVRPMAILLFSDTPINATLATQWKDLSRNRKVHVFRVGTAKPTNELSVGDGESFEDILACSAVNKSTADVRRRPADPEQSPTTTRRQRIIPFSKTTRPPTTTRPVTTPGPKIRPVYRRKDKEAELGKSDVHNVPPAQHNVPPAQHNVLPPQHNVLPAPHNVPPAPHNVLPTSHNVVLPAPRPLFQEPEPSLTVRERSSVHHPQILTAVSTSFIEINTPSTTAPHTQTHRVTPHTTTPATTRSSRVTTAATTTERTPPGCTADIVFLMDFSDGTGDKSKAYLDIAAAAVGRLPISPHAVRVSLVRFSGPGRTETLFHLDKHTNKDDLIEELFRMQPTGGTTRTGEAIHYAIKQFANGKHGARKNVRKFIVLFTDGYAQDDPATAADTAREEGITMLAVAVRDRLRPNEQELIEITRNKEMILISPNGQQIRDKILDDRCPL